MAEIKLRRSCVNRWIIALVVASFWRCVAPAAAQELQSNAPRNVFIPIPVVFYTPETRLALGGALSYIYRAPGSTLEDRPSGLGGTLILTTRSQLLASLGVDHYWNDERQQIKVGAMYRKFPDEFFGIGNDTTDESETYTDEGSGVGLDYLVRILPSLRIGVGIIFGASSITDTESDDQLASGIIPGSNGGQALGAGLRLNYDNRDNVTYPTRGGLYDLSWQAFGSAFIGDFNLNSVELDLRHYEPLGKRNLVALRALGISTGGNVPFQLMPSLGGENLMRGYFAGRFRDRKMVAAQGELRLGLWRRLGGVFFGSLGQVAARGEQIAADRMHYAYGFGLRILLVRQEGLSLRFDWGFTDDQSGFYFGLGEAF